MGVGQSVTWPKVNFILTIRSSKLIHFGKLHMIENRFRVEKQILLGRQLVHRAKSKSKSTEPRNLLMQKAIPESSSYRSQGMPLSPSSPPSGSEGLPLSVDTDAEAAFARESRFYRQGRTSRNPSPNGIRESRQLNPNSKRRRLIPETHEEDDVGQGNNAVPNSTGNPESPSFFSRFRTNSMLSLPFPLEYGRTTSRRESSVENRAENHWSSESSTDDEYHLQ